MKVFLAGATGVIGTRALPALVADGHDVIAVARGPEKADLVRRLGGTPVTVDLFDAAAVRDAVAGVDAVVNLATSIPPLTKASRPSAWAVNERLRTEASAHLVAGGLAGGAERFVQESICFPYLDAGARWIDEDAPIGHDRPPFEGAGRAEAAAARATEEGATGVVLRFAQLVAPEASHTVAMDRLLRRRINPFVGAPESFTSTVHAEDAGSAVVAALRAPAGTYNVADDDPLTRRAAGAAAATRLGLRAPRALPGWMLRASPASAKAIMRSQRVSHARLTEATGWTPVHTSLATYWPTATDRAAAR